VVPSIEAGCTTAGNAEVTLMVCGPLPMPKLIVLGPAVLFEASSASRRLITPSAPGLAIKFAIDEVSPSATSVVAFTVTEAASTTRGDRGHLLGNETISTVRPLTIAERIRKRLPLFIPGKTLRFECMA
jgi:hypothetical protein